MLLGPRVSEDASRPKPRHRHRAARASCLLRHADRPDDHLARGPAISRGGSPRSTIPRYWKSMRSATCRSPQRRHAVLFDRRLEGEVEGVECLHHVEPGGPHRRLQSVQRDCAPRSRLIDSVPTTRPLSISLRMPSTASSEPGTLRSASMPRIASRCERVAT